MAKTSNRAISKLKNILSSVVEAEAGGNVVARRIYME